MTKRLILAAASLALVASPLLMSVHADAGGFTPLMANAAWNYGTYRVEKLAFSDAAVGPFTLGNTVFVAEPTTEIGVYNLTLIKNGKGKMIPNVPASAFDAKRFAMNGDRLVFARPTSDLRSHYDVIEASLDTGAETVLAKDVFVENADKVSVVVNGGLILFEFEYANVNPNKAFRQQAVYQWYPQESKAYPIAQHFELNREEIQDVSGGLALVKMTFENGYKQLWVMDSKVVDGHAGSMKAIPDTYTIPTEDIVGAHFQQEDLDGNPSAVYFRNYTLNSYRGFVETYKWDTNPPSTFPDQTITWFRNPNNSVQSTFGEMAWIDAKDGIHAYNIHAGTEAFGTAAFGRFHLENQDIYFATDHAGKVATYVPGHFGTASFAVTELPVGVTDVSGKYAVGINGVNEIATLDLSTGVAHDVGTGSSPVIDADGRAYWHGVNAGIFSVTFTGKLAVTAPAGKTVPSVKDASGHFVRGSLVKFVGRSTVFVVGADRRLNSIPNEATARNLFGSEWNHKITEVTDIQMIDYPLGGVVNTADDLAKI